MDDKTKTSLHELHARIMEAFNMNSDEALEFMCQHIHKGIEEKENNLFKVGNRMHGFEIQSVFRDTIVVHPINGAFKKYEIPKIILRNFLIEINQLQKVKCRYHVGSEVCHSCPKDANN